MIIGCVVWKKRLNYYITCSRSKSYKDYYGIFENCDFVPRSGSAGCVCLYRQGRRHPLGPEWRIPERPLRLARPLGKQQAYPGPPLDLSRRLHLLRGQHPRRAGSYSHHPESLPLRRRHRRYQPAQGRFRCGMRSGRRSQRRLREHAGRPSQPRQAPQEGKKRRRILLQAASRTKDF